MKEADMWKYSMCLLFLCPKDNNKYQRSLFHTVIYPTPQVCTDTSISTPKAIRD